MGEGEATIGKKGLLSARKATSLREKQRGAKPEAPMILNTILNQCLKLLLANPNSISLRIPIRGHVLRQAKLLHVHLKSIFPSKFWSNPSPRAFNYHSFNSTNQGKLRQRFHDEVKLFRVAWCLLVALRDYYGSRDFTIYKMRNGSSVWSVRYLVNTDDFMNPLLEGWSICSTVWSIVLGEREDDSCLVINLSGKVVFSKTLHEIYNIGSNQLDDNRDDDELVMPFEADHNVFEFISSFASVDYYGSRDFTIYKMRNGCSVWSVRYLVNTDDFMNLLLEGWSICSTIWSIVLGEREDDSCLVINLSGKVVEYNLISKTLHEIYDIGSNQLDDNRDDDELVMPFEADHNVFEFIPSFASV
nr:hypothetical protein [Tanacetum cinerariifolium]